MRRFPRGNRTALPRLRLLSPDRQQCLEMRRFRFPVNYLSRHFGKSHLLKEAAKLDFCETEPNVGIHLARLLELVPHEIQNGHPTARTEDTPSFGNGVLRVQGVVKGLTEKRQIHFTV